MVGCLKGYLLPDLTLVTEFPPRRPFYDRVGLLVYVYVIVD